MKRVLVVGRGSFLARHIVKVLPASHVTAVPHTAIGDPGLLDGIDCVVNCARHPMLAGERFGEAHDIDARLARRIGTRPIAYVMLSTRKVYAASPQPLAETSPLAPGDVYGRNKLAIEERLRNLLEERLTILRIGNVFGDERLPGRTSFMTAMLHSLGGEGRIVFDMSPFVARDFLPVERFARALRAVVDAPPGGIVNIGSGVALPTGRMALWLIEGFGRGELLITSSDERDGFVLDVARMRNLTGVSSDLADLRRACLALGRRLHDGIAT